MGNHTRDAVGVDISKAHLDVHRLNTGEAAQFGNDAAGFEALAAWIGASVDEVVPVAAHLPAFLARISHQGP